jgi:pimeloyl-ACP methyl ester carboxylesterase
MKLLPFSLLLIVSLIPVAAGQTPEPMRVRVNGVELAYIEAGKGEPLIFLHGGQADYRSWAPYFAKFEDRYRVIAYSRRYNFPNDNPIRGRRHSAYVEADDLAAFVKELKLRNVHLVGTSIGAYAALIYAVRNSENVASLTLAEPAINAWVEHTPEYEHFNSNAWLPAAKAFRMGDDRGAMRLLVDIFGGEGSFDKMPPQAQAVAMSNARFFKAATLSRDPIPDIARSKVQRLPMPVLLIEGEDTFTMSKLIMKEIVRLLPKARHVTIPHAGHGSFRENPAAFGDAVLDFISRPGVGRGNE